VQSTNCIDAAALLNDSARIESVPVSMIPALLAQFAAVQCTLAARLVFAAQQSPSPAGADELLDVNEAAARLGVSPDWLRHRSTGTKTLPFVVRLGRNVRFSALGIDKYIKNRQGR
jgi:predicted DNA-binding transcriptional regulator AlpA